MIAQGVAEDATTFARETLRMLDEYIERMEGMARAIRESRDRVFQQRRRPSSGWFTTGEMNGGRVDHLEADYQFEQARFQAVYPHLLKLAQSASQLIEHAALEDIVRMELRLRLAEFESILTGIQSRYINPPEK